MSVKSETEIQSRKAPCAWFARQDRQDNDEKIVSCGLIHRSQG